MARDLYNRAPASMEEENEFRSFAVAQNRFVNRVFGWMSAGLALTGVTAWYVASNYDEQIATMGAMWIVLLLLEFGVVIGLTAAINKLTAAQATAGFLFYSVLNGITLSIIFLFYTQSTISMAFFTACGTFAGMGLYGFMTKRDLTSVGSFCGMALWGLIIGSILNMFFRSGNFSLIMSYVGVIVFVGLTAYDTQKIKQLATAHAAGMIEEETAKKYAILGALELYLDFVNLFLYLLRIFGNRR